MNQITNEYNMNMGDASQYGGTKSAVGGKQASVSHMQPSNTNKAFRGYANVVDKNAKRGATNMNINSGALNQQSGLELANVNNTSGTSIGFKNATQSQF